MQTKQAISMYLGITYTHAHTNITRQETRVMIWKENSGWAYMEGFGGRKGKI